MNRKLDHAYLALECIGAALAIYISVRILVGPDGFKTAKMAVVRSAARVAKQRGEQLTTLGNRLDSAYWKIAQ